MFDFQIGPADLHECHVKMNNCKNEIVDFFE